MVLSEERLKLFRVQCLDQHNYYRSLHGCPPLKLDPKLNASANHWALHISRINRLMFSESEQYGQAVHKSCNRNISGRQPVVAWYRAIQYFCFGAPSYNPRARNFIQMIWKGTTDLGVGVAVKDNVIWVVAHYRPGMNPCSVRFNVPPRLDRPRVWPALCWFEDMKVELLMKMLLQVLVELVEYAFM